ncbi:MULTISPECIES: CGNR zinc finger domain-containing protein [Nonomuraea]|uniref:CGNR zinc finger domain-containing protein n=2 Tax=Nonomuraea TaxID=83681 RepID=A0ABW1C393_9ACTN|nr:MULTISPECIES: CGNR zinc finger domain-containing protein [Nonomuraea]MDA0646903.1 CGNR zinc finger domain-containing protein [Nonomuraea ferruginea]TXK35734.1 CGNR zinc finger domain-containing protein [Nonomuraea sp. C10]
MDFNSHGDAVIRVAVGLVNSLTPGERRGRPAPPPAGLAEAATEGLRTGYPGHKPVTEAEGSELAEVAQRLRAVFEAVAAGDVDAAAERINALLAETGARPMLMRHDGEPWHLHYHGPGGTLAGDWAASCATGLAHVLGSEFHDRLGVCTAPHCDRVYVDVSRNGTRRFCSTACQNRVKTAAFRARSKTP